MRLAPRDARLRLERHLPGKRRLWQPRTSISSLVSSATRSAAAPKYFQHAWELARPSTLSCVAKKEDKAERLSRPAPAQLQFDPPEEMARAPRVHPEESRMEISEGILRAVRDTQKLRWKEDINGSEFRPAPSK